MIAEFIKLFERDLNRLEMEINAFQNEIDLWKTKGNVKNSAGNLCLHLIGNLRTYVGKNLGSVAYIRDREAEFNSKNIPRETLIENLNITKAAVRQALAQMNIADLDNPYPEEVLGYPMTTGHFLIHLTGHLTYHLGQINYLRRILEE